MKRFKKQTWLVEPLLKPVFPLIKPGMQCCGVNNSIYSRLEKKSSMVFRIMLCRYSSNPFFLKIF